MTALGTLSTTDEPLEIQSSSWLPRAIEDLEAIA
jgi:hypothetical protein